MSISKAIKSNPLLTQHSEIQAHQNLGLKQISWAVGNMLLQDHDRIELKKTLQETLEANFSQRGPIILGFGGPHHPFQATMLWACIGVAAWKWCQQGASKGNNRMWIITVLSQFYLAVKSLGLGIFPYCSTSCITPAPAHFIHAAHTSP